MGKGCSLWSYAEMGLFFSSREAYDLAIGEFKRALAMALFPIAALHVNLTPTRSGRQYNQVPRLE